MLKKIFLILLSTTLHAGEQGPMSSVIGAGYCIHNIKQLVNMASKIYTNNFPDDEKKAAINRARETNEFFTTKKELRDCLIKNEQTPRNAAGRPTVCEELAYAFVSIAGKHELDKLTENFKIAYQE